MKKKTVSVPSGDHSEQALSELLGRLDPQLQKRMADIRKQLQKRFPSLSELVYDYGRSIMIAWSPNERGSDGIVALEAKGDEVKLFFTQGVNLPDPDKILSGKATQVRFILLDAAKDLSRPEVVAMMSAAEKLSPVKIPGTGKGTLILKESKKKK